MLNTREIGNGRKIRFVRMYEAYRENWYEVVYGSNKVFTFTENELPKTVLNFVLSAENRIEQYDKVFKRTEMLYF